MTANPPDPLNLSSANAAEAFGGAAMVAVARAVAVGGRGTMQWKRTKGQEEFYQLSSFLRVLLLCFMFPSVAP